MSYNSDLQANNEELQAILNTVNALPDANSGGKDGYSIFYADAEIPYPMDEGVNFFVAMSKLSNEGDGIKEGDLVISSNGTLCKVTLVQQEYSRVNCFPLASIASSGGNGENGEDGFSPIATVTQTDSGAVISITDKDGTTTATITNGKDGAKGDKGDKGDPGEKGASPTISLEPYEDSFGNGVMVTVDNHDGSVESYTIPNGKDGENGFSAFVSVTKSGNVATITTRDNDTGTQTVEVYDGEDYVLTEADKAEIAEMAADLVDVPDSGGYVAYDEAQELTPEQQAQALNNIGAMSAAKFNKIFDTFPTVEQINALSNWEFFTTRGFYSKNDGLGATYLVRTSSSSFCIPYGDRYFRPVVTDWNTRDIFVDLYGVRRCAYDDANFADISARNSEIMSALMSTLQNGFTFHFASGHYYFANPIVANKYVTFKGVSSNACVYGNPNVNSDSNYGTYLHFPNLSNGESAISILGGVVEDVGISGNPSICNVSLNRSNTVINPNSIVTLVDTGTTYGIKVKDNHTIHNVKVRNCTYGIYAESTNALISNIDVRYCKVGISVGNDIKVNNVQAWNVMVGVELRGQLASASNVRGDSIGKHLIECKKGRCLLTNIDGDYCMGSLIHYGGGDIKYIHLGQATACMGRIATKYAYSRSSGFDLRNVPADDYEYCSYISIAPDTQVFGGQVDLVNVSTNPHDTSSSYVHPNAVISIGTGSTVKGVLIKCDIPNDADVEYFNAKVIKSLSTHAEADNDTSAYLTNFDGNTIEDIGLITPSRFVRSVRTLTNPDRVLDAPKDGTSVTVKSVDESTEDGGSNTITFSDGKVVNIKNGSKGSKGDKGDPYTLNDTDKDAIASTVKSSIQKSDVTNILGYTPADKADTSVVTDMVVGVGVSVPSINLNDGVYEYGRFAAAGTEHSDSTAFRNKNYLPVTGGRTIACWFAKADWNKNNIGFSVQIVQYDATKTKLTNRVDMNNYALNARPSFKLEENTAFIRISVYPAVTFSTPLTDIELAVYYIEDVTLGYVSPEPTIIGEKKLSLEEAVIPSSTPGSSKKFRLTIDDSGIITAVEIT